VLDQRRKSLEDIFFQQHDRDRLRPDCAGESAAQPRTRLADATGIRDPAVLDSLAAAGLEPRVAAGLALVPLLEVAWADGELDAEEKLAMLRAAPAAGVEPESPAYALFESWIRRRPHRRLFEAWRDYVDELTRTLDAKTLDAVRRDTLVRTRAVAEAASALLGLGGTISTGEADALAQLEKHFTPEGKV
jgi:hypothetical protein